MRSRSLACLLTTAAAATLTGTASAGIPTPPDAGVLVLMDRSGSMAGTITTCPEFAGTSVPKWQCAKQKAINWINSMDYNHFDPNDPASPIGRYKYWFWQLRYFASDSTYVEKDEVTLGAAGIYDRDGILARLNGWTGPLTDDAATPLAQVACDGIDLLLDQNDLPARYLRLETDGLENHSNPLHKCAGTGSTPTYSHPVGVHRIVCLGPVDCTPSTPLTTTVVTADNLTVPTWQSSLLAQGLTGLLSNASPLPIGYYTSTQWGAFYPTTARVITEIDYFDDWVPAGAGGLSMRYAPSAAAAAPAPLAVGVDQPLAASAMFYSASSLASVSAAATGPSNPYDSDVAFFSGLAESTGGRLIRWRSDGSGSSDPGTFPHAIAGDVNDSGCVDAVDLTFVSNLFGQKASSANPDTFRADVTYDGLVDVRDYQVVRSHWGSGCATPPPAPALPMQVLFGFEDATKWSSAQAPLATEASPITGGSYSLYVGKTGTTLYREISSVKFNTSILQGVKSKIAYDVYIPTQQTNRSWLGQTLFFVSCPSAGINNLSLGNVEFTGKPLGRFTTATFNLPANVQNAMKTAHSDVSFKIVINANDKGYVLDSLRFQ